MSPQRLYDTDFYAWTQDQAEKLRAARDNRLDAEHLAEEVADLGRSELRAVEAHLLQLFVHLLKAAFSPGDAPKAGWRGEIRQHQLLLRKAFSPSMRAKIDLEELWSVARDTASDTLEQHGEGPVPGDVACPFDLDALVARDFDVDRAIRQLAPGA
jgi:hypothetical protein